MRIFYDTEFLERGPTHPIDLISIGMVREDAQWNRNVFAYLASLGR